MMRHGGDTTRLARSAGCEVGSLLDFSANLNPLGPPPWLRRVISSHVGGLAHYPDPHASELVEAFARKIGASGDEIVAANGSSEILSWLPIVAAPSRAVVAVPSYGEYARTCALARIPVHAFPLREEDEFVLNVGALETCLRAGDLVFLGQPNNPTGRTFEAAALRRLARDHPAVAFVVDEAFADFVPQLDRLLADRPPNLTVVCSLTKFYAIPGLRLGLAVAPRDLAGRLRDRLPPWSVNAMAQAVGVEALAEGAYCDETRRLVDQERAWLLAALRAVPGLHPYPGEANFLLVRIAGPSLDASELARRALRERVAIRPCTSFEGLDGRFFRVAVRTRTENERLCEALRSGLGMPRGGVRARSTPAIMVAGASSDAGKSVLAAALCRMLVQDGYRVAPFKAQNMSNNSFVTGDGGEMGRAQVTQAQACRIPPDVRMNPVLLKPDSEVGAQVVLLGRPVGQMDVRTFIAYKSQAFAAAREAYDSLAATHDVMVLEGAGSIGEVNLKAHDMVNLAMARHASAPVLVVGDIDRGGVFASFIGHMEVLAEWERALVAGFVVNRFRGRRDLLGDALEYTRRHTGRPVLGVIPYLSRLDLPDEDSVSFKARRNGKGAEQPERSESRVEIAVVDLPYISNFTDFDALEQEPDVHLRVARTPADLDGCDAVILPGSKSVASDLAWLRATGVADGIVTLARENRCAVVGICGGLQILGERISDPHRVESAGGPVAGLGLLPVVTEMAAAKTLRAVAGSHAESGLAVRGYEIHHGRTVAAGASNLAPALAREDGEPLGYGLHRVWGTYLHGVFDADPFRRWFLDELRVRRGLGPLGAGGARFDLEPALERLAAVVREHLDVSAIYHRMGLQP